MMPKFVISLLTLLLLAETCAGQDINTNADDNDVIILNTAVPLVLQCNVTNMPRSSIIWKRENVAISETDHDYIKINSNDFSLNIEKPKENRDVGRYDCIVAIENRLINASIFVQSNVTVEDFHKSLNLVQGDKLVLTCKIKTGYPPPTITWYKDSINVMNDSAGRIKFESDKDIKAAKLIIEELEYEDKAYYTCEAQSSVNSVNTTILVRVKDKLAALWPFLGICAEVAILCTIIFVYEKKRVKPDFDESDTDQNTENKNVSDQKEGGPDVRQRK